VITIVDYRMGNIGSLVNMFQHIGEEVIVTNEPADILRADKLLLPGVGAYGIAMQRINGLPGLRDALDEVVLNREIPILGICLGMQLFTDFSEEGNQEGLGWIPGSVVRLALQPELRVPHMGWNEVKITNRTPMTESISKHSRFYFAHSYHVVVADANTRMLSTVYGEEFNSGINHKNIFGVQFHPEKSLKSGMEILRSFSEM